MKNLFKALFPNTFIQSLYLSLIAFALGFFVMTFKYEESTPHFVEQPEFIAWLFVMSAVPAVAFNFLIPSWTTYRKLRKQVSIRAWEFVILCLGLIIIVGIPFAITAVPFLTTIPDRFLSYHPIKLIVLTFWSLLVAVISVNGIYLIYLKLRELREIPAIDDENIREFLNLRNQLQVFTTATSIVIGMAVLGAGTLRTASLAMYDDKSIFPPESVLTYGAYYTLFLALILIPVYSTFLEVGQIICEKICPLPSLSEDENKSLPKDSHLPEPDDWAKIYDKRKKLEEYLGVNQDFVRTLQNGLIVAVPLLSSALSLLTK